MRGKVLGASGTPPPTAVRGLRLALADEGVDVRSRLLLGHAHGGELLGAGHDAGLEQGFAGGGQLAHRGAGARAVGELARHAGAGELVAALPLLERSAQLRLRGLPVRAPLFERHELLEILLRDVEQGVRLLELAFGAQRRDLAGGLGGGGRLREIDRAAVLQCGGRDLAVLPEADAAAVAAQFGPKNSNLSSERK